MPSYDGLDERQLARLLGVPLLRLHDAVPSTLDLAHELGAAGAPHGSVVLADAQTAGRGRHGRAWVSPPGGLWLALLARPHAPPLGGALAVRVGLAARGAVADAAPETAPRLKWPNDIMVAGGKAGGVLCEACWTGPQLSWIAIGVGINVRGPLPAALQDRAIALEDIAAGVTRTALLAALVPRLLQAAAAPPALSDAERGAFLEAAWCDGAGEAPEGLDPDGALLLRRADGSLDRIVHPA